MWYESVTASAASSVFIIKFFPSYTHTYSIDIARISMLIVSDNVNRYIAIPHIHNSYVAMLFVDPDV